MSNQQFTPQNKPIEEATDDELAGFLTRILQVEGVAKLKTREKLLAAITAAGWTLPHVTVLVEAEREFQPDEGVAVRREAQELASLKTSHHYRDDPVVEVEITETSLPGGNEPAYVSVNGHNLVIPRNKVWKLPYRFYLALKDAHEVRVTQDHETRELIYTKITNYPMNRGPLPSEAEIAEWNERVADKVLGA